MTKTQPSILHNKNDARLHDSWKWDMNLPRKPKVWGFFLSLAGHNPSPNFSLLFSSLSSHIISSKPFFPSLYKSSKISSLTLQFLISLYGNFLYHSPVLHSMIPLNSFKSIVGPLLMYWTTLSPSHCLSLALSSLCLINSSK